MPFIKNAWRSWRRLGVPGEKSVKRMPVLDSDTGLVSAMRTGTREPFILAEIAETGAENAETDLKKIFYLKVPLRSLRRLCDLCENLVLHMLIQESDNIPVKTMRTGTREPFHSRRERGDGRRERRD